jgi:MerR family mercuric resistance operon transcriptional regulator
MKHMTISGLAQMGNVGIETVRFYQRLGLLETPDRPSSGIRRYGQEHVRTLRFIRAAKSAGFTLDEIGELITLDATNDRTRARQLANKRIEALNTKIAELNAARKALKHLAHECAVGSSGPCPILASFDHLHDRP